MSWEKCAWRWRIVPAAHVTNSSFPFIPVQIASSSKRGRTQLNFPLDSSLAGDLVDNLICNASIQAGLRDLSTDILNTSASDREGAPAAAQRLC